MAKETFLRMPDLAMILKEMLLQETEEGEKADLREEKETTKHP
jgi:hypothetical protein